MMTRALIAASACFNITMLHNSLKWNRFRISESHKKIKAVYCPLGSAHGISRLREAFDNHVASTSA